MHTLFSYHCLFRPISILLHTLNSTLYFVLFRTFNSVITTVIHCSLPVRRLTFCQPRLPRITLSVNHQPYRVAQKASDVSASDV